MIGCVVEAFVGEFVRFCVGMGDRLTVGVTVGYAVGKLLGVSVGIIHGI